MANFITEEDYIQAKKEVELHFRERGGRVRLEEMSEYFRTHYPEHYDYFVMKSIRQDFEQDLRQLEKLKQVREFEWKGNGLTD